MENEKKIIVNLPEGFNQSSFTLNIREGRAQELLKPDVLNPIKLRGTIRSPEEWLIQRCSEDDIKNSHIVVDYNNLSLTLFVNDRSTQLRDEIEGVIKLNPIIDELGINSPKKLWTPNELGEFLKMNGYVFSDQTERFNLINNLKSFNARVQKEIEDTEKQSEGKYKSIRDVIINSNLPKEPFYLCLDLFGLEGVYSFGVEIYLYGNSSEGVTLRLVSSELSNIVNTNGKDIIANCIGDILNRFPKLAMIYKQ